MRREARKIRDDPENSQYMNKINGEKSHFYQEWLKPRIEAYFEKIGQDKQDKQDKQDTDFEEKADV